MMPTGRVCRAPGCGASIEGKPLNTVWCSKCRRKQDSSRAKRRAMDHLRVPWERERTGRRCADRCAEPAREAEPKCHLCGGMPWAREPGRFHEGHGASSGGKIEIAPNWECIGCGEKYAPEPPMQLIGTVRSSAAMAADHGKLFGWEGMGRTEATGKRKGAK